MLAIVWRKDLVSPSHVWQSLTLITHTQIHITHLCLCTIHNSHYMCRYSIRANITNKQTSKKKCNKISNRAHIINGIADIDDLKFPN